jgi:hypothetical protein
MSLIDSANGPSVDFGALSSAASEKYDSIIGQETPSADIDVAKEDNVEAKEASGISPDPAATQQVKQSAKLTDDDLVEVVVDGETKLIPYKEAKNGWAAHAKFTKEMQALSTQREQFNQSREQIVKAIQYAQQLETEREQLVGILKNPAQLQQLVQRYAQQEQKQDEFLTTREVQQREQQLRQQLEQSFEQRLAQLGNVKQDVVQQVLDIQETQKYEVEFDTHVDTLFKENPVLNSIDGVEELLRYHVASKNPQTMDEARTIANEMVKKWTGGIRSQFGEAKKQEVIEREKLKTEGILTNEGAKPGIKATNWRKPDGKIDFNKLRELADQY